jgi:S1-C subfamily serine protease
VRRALTLATLVLTGAGCLSPTRAPDRSDLIRRILASTVQLRSERDGEIRRAASGVVVAMDLRSQRTWIVTARHFVDPSPPQNIYVRLPGRISVVPGTLAFMSPDRDLALIEAQYLDVVPARLKMEASLGDDILVVAFPWGQRFTVVQGVVSQVSTLASITGPARMVDASVSYGSSGGGVFDAKTGELVGIVESYRIANVTIPEIKERVLEVPVAGETTLISAPAILRLVVDSGLSRFLPR